MLTASRKEKTPIIYYFGDSLLGCREAVDQRKWAYGLGATPERYKSKSRKGGGMGREEEARN